MWFEVREYVSMQFQEVQLEFSRDLLELKCLFLPELFALAYQLLVFLQSPNCVKYLIVK